MVPARNTAVINAPTAVAVRKAGTDRRRVQRADTKAASTGTAARVQPRAFEAAWFSSHRCVAS
ncbi:hypothetical protein ACFQFC_15450 [Amorphoplanes digitatis]|uniref:hypothetical protein n=1 Tax=Actinoplanes digitatis TaxID=1868 RepID=UPI003610DD2E